MKTMKKITAVLLILVSVFCLSACHIGDIKINFYSPYWEFWNYSKGNFTYTASEINEVDITWVGGEIEIVSSDKDILSVTENSDALEDDAKMHYHIEDGKLTIHYSKALYKEKIDTASKHLRIEVPEGIEIDIDNVSANIKIEEMALGEIKVTNVSGNVEFESLACSELKIENVDGSVTAKEIVADEFKAEDASGAIIIDKISSNEIKASTFSGKIKIGIAASSEVSVSGMNTDIELSIPEDIGATIEFSTAGGKLNSDMPHKSQKNTYTFGGGKIEIKVETVNGNLYIS